MDGRSPANIRFAIVGCGRIGGRHAEHARKFGQIAGVCDINPERAKTVAKAHNTNAFFDFDEMLKTLQGRSEVISICTPNGLHCKQTVSAFKAGYHVLCEKPMALSVEECGEMIKAGERANRRLFIVKQNRYNPPVEHLKRLLDSGALGRVFSVHLNCYWNRNDIYYSKGDWRGTLAMDGGTLYTQFSHFIDLLYWLVGDVRDAQAFVNNYCHQNSIEFEDSGVAILRFHNGTIGNVNFTINSFGKNMEGSLTLFCELGTVKVGGQYLNEIEYENVKGMGRTALREGRRANEYGEYQGSMSNHEDVYQNVFDVLTGVGSMGTVGFEGLKTVEIIDKIYRAAKNVS